jgi:hypothetical protein
VFDENGVWRTSFKFFEDWCNGFGYSVDEAMPCVISRSGENCVIDTRSGFFPRLPKNYPRRGYGSTFRAPALHGPGTELKSLLAGWPFRIVSTADCKCTSRAAYMDAKGCDWCASEEGMAEIIGFLREAAEERGLPFVDIAARLLVRRAIANARKAEAARAREAERPPLHTEQ